MWPIEGWSYRNVKEHGHAAKKKNRQPPAVNMRDRISVRRIVTVEAFAELPCGGVTILREAAIHTADERQCPERSRRFRKAECNHPQCQHQVANRHIQRESQKRTDHRLAAAFASRLRQPSAVHLMYNLESRPLGCPGDRRINRHQRNKDAEDSGEDNKKSKQPSVPAEGVVPVSSHSAKPSPC